MTVFLFTLAALALAMTLMAVGVLVSNRELRGSCGGAAVRGPDGEPLTCSNCDCGLAEEACETDLETDQPRAEAA